MRRQLLKAGEKALAGLFLLTVSIVAAWFLRVDRGAHEYRALVRSIIATDAEIWDNREQPYGGYVLYQVHFEADPDYACTLRQQASNALFMTDQEGGSVVRLHDPAEAVPVAPADAVALGFDGYRAASIEVARQLQQHCIDINLAPVMEPATGNVMRSASTDMVTAAEYATVFADAMRAGGVVPVFKHFPGSTGAARRLDAHPALISGAEPIQYIETYDGQLRDIALHYGLLSADDIVMISNNLYDGYGDGPAVFNTLFYDWLRQDIGFRGLIITDDLDEVQLRYDDVLVAAREADMLMAVRTAQRDKLEAMLLKAIDIGDLDPEMLRRKAARWQALVKRRAATAN